jgi:V8-like Glu-specific endopeptidase
MWMFTNIGFFSAVAAIKDGKTDPSRVVVRGRRREHLVALMDAFKLTAKRVWSNGRIVIEAKKQIEGGTSGSPIVDDAGELVGVVSNTSEGAKKCTGQAPIPALTLPVWTLQAIKREAKFYL